MTAENKALAQKFCPQVSVIEAEEMFGLAPVQHDVAL